ncbi:uncharacterized protein LOC125940765 [Dermacentor silvarum]|uniref:uncharacterized protein LOC125940765 n=1 Tax=Dermacentor silvarum TaxID=543639 RepID=UPI0021015721|nr:uncharacterized protein LOC125940765 [Dermacentor silvarum]
MFDFSSVKPPLVCHMVSPQYQTDPIEKEKIVNSLVPSPGVCDYIMFDIPQEADGKYNRAAYEQLGRYATVSKCMFSVNVYDTVVSSLTTTLDKTTLTDTARDILQTVPLYGFGILGEVSLLNASVYSRAILTINAGILNSVYERFTEVMTGLGIGKSEVANFFAFRPRYLAILPQSYQGLLEGLNTISNGYLRFVMLLTITSQTSSFVQPSSAWNRLCLASGDEPTIEGAVDLISKIKSPVFTFALTISLRWDLFTGVKLTHLASEQLGNVTSSTHRSLRYEEECSWHFTQSDPAITYAGGGGCAFTEITTKDVASFDTEATIQYKMRNAYQRLNQSGTSLLYVGWLVYDVTGGLEPFTCYGPMQRLEKIREIIDTI